MTTKKMVLNGQEVDFSNALPLKVKDWRALEKHGVTMDTFINAAETRPTMEQMVQVAIRILARVGKDEAFVDELSLNDLMAVFKLLAEKEADPAEVNRPT